LGAAVSDADQKIGCQQREFKTIGMPPETPYGAYRTAIPVENRPRTPELLTTLHRHHDTGLRRAEGLRLRRRVKPAYGALY
jgi:hypothetical protein